MTEENGMIRGIHHVAINTANYEKIIDFYRRAFGFEVCAPEISWHDSPYVDDIVGLKGSAARTVMLKAGTAYLEVFEYFAPPSRIAEPLRPSDHGYTHFAVDTDDIEADFERLKAAGMTFTHQVPDAQGGIRALYGKDPDGNVIELQQLTKDHDFALERLQAPTRLPK
jgi:catechol 2,3-dioxygenase-like lactoylglutathione lyase family enzyme